MIVFAVVVVLNLSASIVLFVALFQPLPLALIVACVVLILVSAMGRAVFVRRRARGSGESPGRARATTWRTMKDWLTFFIP